MKAIRKMSKKTIIIIVSVIAAVIILCVVFGVIIPSRAAKNNALQTVVIAKGDLTAIVGATGTVNADKSAFLSWQTSGQVELVNVQIGDLVKTDQPLASLLQTSLSQNIILATSDLVTAQRALENLTLSNLAAAQAEQALVTAQKAYDDAKNKIVAPNVVRGSKDQRDKYYSQLLQAQKAYDMAVKYYNIFVDKPDTDADKAQAYSQLSAAQRQLDTAKANYDFVSGTFSVTEVEQSTANLAVAKAQLADAQREYDRLRNGPDPMDIAAAQAKVDAIKATLDTASQIAPFDGTVTEVLSSVGDLVTPGTKAFRVDDLKHLSVDIQVTEVDIARIKFGQDATLSFDAILGTEYHGKVTQVAQAGDVVQGVASFNVRVALTDADASILPGMTAAVNVIVSQIKDVILVPNRAIRVLNGASTVYVLRNGKQLPITITLGASSDTDSQVLSGDLNVEDVIILNPPTSIIPAGGGGARNPFGG